MSKKRTETLHLYRSILRECGYLLDPASQKYIKGRVIERFKAYQAECPNLLGCLKIGRNALSVLKRANEGYSDPLFKVLCLTYGRQGKRRRELLSQIAVVKVQKPPEASNPDYIRREITKRFTLPKAALAELPKMSMAVEALMKSQRASLDDETRGKGPLKRSLDMPLKDIWGRQLPFKRIKNKTRAWYAGILERLMPPLPDQEWHRLAGFASGKTTMPMPVPRRPRGTDVFDDSDNALARPAEDAGFTTILEELGVKQTRRKADYKQSQHFLTKRFIQRTYQRLFKFCPLMSWDEGRQRTTFTWGSTKSNTMTKRNTRLLAAFEADVDEITDQENTLALTPEPLLHQEEIQEMDRLESEDGGGSSGRQNVPPASAPETGSLQRQEYLVDSLFNNV